MHHTNVDDTRKKKQKFHLQTVARIPNVTGITVPTHMMEIRVYETRIMQLFKRSHESMAAQNQKKKTELENARSVLYYGKRLAVGLKL